MSSIGAANFDIMHGLPTQQKTRVDTWVVPGLDGIGAQTLGQGGDEFDLTTVSFLDSDTEAEDFIVSCQELQGTLQDITDDFGDSYVQCLILKCDASNAKKPCIYNGNADAIRVQIQWKAIATVS